MSEPPPSSVPLVSPSLPLSESLSSFSLSIPSPLPGSGGGGDDDDTTRDSDPTATRVTASRPEEERAGGGGGGPRRAAASYSRFERLPPELIELVAQAVVRETNLVGPPRGLVNLLLVSKRFDRVLGFKHNKGFYAELFKERFDTAGVERRWSTMRTIQEKREKLELLQTLPESRPSLQEAVHLNPAYSFTRPSSPTSAVAGDPFASPWDPLTNRDYANELVRRSTVLTKMRTAATQGGFFPNRIAAVPPSRPTSPRLMSFTPTRGTTKLCEPDELTQNLWTCYLMLLENDGKNLPHLLEYACLKEYMRLFYRHSLLAEALNPGWPRQTAGRALGLWIGWLGGDDLASETAQESEERFFVLKPYVFAAHKFDAFLAPWTIRHLPVSHEQYPVVPPPDGPYLADLRPRSTAQTIVHMGRRVDLSPPNLSHAAILSFFFRVEQDPAVQDDLLVHGGTGTPAAAAPAAPLAGFGAGAGAGGGAQHVGGLTAHSRPTKTTLPVLRSAVHDRDFVRLGSCIDPYTSVGLPSLYTRGDWAGNWEGRFSFFDFDSYRDMLGGRMRSLYEGPFGDQPQVWKLDETVVKLDRRGGGGRREHRTTTTTTTTSSTSRPDHDDDNNRPPPPPPASRDPSSSRPRRPTHPGGTGPVLNAGFEFGAAVPMPTPTHRASGGGGRSSSTSRSPPPAPVQRRRRTSSSGQLESVIMELDERNDESSGPVARGGGGGGGGGGTGTGTTIAGGTGGGGGDGGAAKKQKKRFRPDEDSFWEDHDDADADDFGGGGGGGRLEDGAYEILLTGSGHSAWGQFNLRGRVRSWDGMFTIVKEYTPDSRGRWIYRGYRIGDSLVGRWRDTHTPVDMSGYEGTWR
ncbi:hypothetical protein JCM11491_006024 [Sporobolomyces phaffii]